MADGADAALGVQHILVALSVDASVLPFALLDIVSVTEVFCVKVVIATIDYANARRLLAVSVHRMTVPQEALVVHLAQALSLHWLSAAFFSAFRKLDPLP